MRRCLARVHEHVESIFLAIMLRVLLCVLVILLLCGTGYYILQSLRDVQASVEELRSCLDFLVDRLASLENVTKTHYTDLKEVHAEKARNSNVSRRDMKDEPAFPPAVTTPVFHPLIPSPVEDDGASSVSVLEAVLEEEVEDAIAHLEAEILHP